MRWQGGHHNIKYYIISSVMHAFWLVLTYDLLEGRRIDDVITKTFFPYILILYYIKQIDSKLPCVCSVIDHRWRKNVVRTSVTHSAAPRVPLFCSYHILTSFVIYYWTDARQLGIYLLNLYTASLNPYNVSKSALKSLAPLIKLLEDVDARPVLQEDLAELTSWCV